MEGPKGGFWYALVRVITLQSMRCYLAWPYGQKQQESSIERRETGLLHAIMAKLIRTEPNYNVR